jgi:hypothetical protein
VEEAEGFARMAREDSQRLEELKSMVKESRDDSCFLSFVKKRKNENTISPKMESN